MRESRYTAGVSRRCQKRTNSICWCWAQALSSCISASVEYDCTSQTPRTQTWQSAHSAARGSAPIRQKLPNMSLSIDFKGDKHSPNLLRHNANVFGVALDTHMLIKDMQECFQGPFQSGAPAAFFFFFPFSSWFASLATMPICHPHQWK